MIFLDTNVVVSLLDEQPSTERSIAEDLIARAGTVWISREVVLELGWVLKSAFKLTRSDVDDAFARLRAMPAIRFEEPERVELALGLHASGLDFGDAAIVAHRHDGATVATFDRRFIRKAQRAFDAPSPVQDVARAALGGA